MEKINETSHFFASVIGLIDGYIDFLKREIEFNSNFNTKSCKEEIKKDCHEQIELLTIRSDIFTEFKKRDTQSSPNILEKALETIPSYNFFTELYNDITINGYPLHLGAELINSYNIGYTSFGRCSFDDIIDLYKELIEELKEYELLNKIKLDSARNKVILKSIRRKNR